MNNINNFCLSTASAVSGFEIKFTNGLTASVKWGSLNMCENFRKNGNTTESPTADVAVYETVSGRWHKAANFIASRSSSSDTTEGFCTPEEVAEFLSNVAKAKC